MTTGCHHSSEATPDVTVSSTVLQEWLRLPTFSTSTEGHEAVTSAPQSPLTLPDTATVPELWVYTS